MANNSSTRLRLLALGLVGLLLVGLIAWAARSGWRDFVEVDEGLDAAGRGNFRVSETFHADLHELNHTLLRFAIREAPSELESFAKQSKELSQWIDLRKSQLTMAEEHEVLERIDLAYGDYLAAASDAIATAQRTTELREVLAALDKSNLASSRLVELGNELARANDEARRKWREDLRKSLEDLQRLIFGSLLCLLALGVITSVFVYRQMIAPLHHQLEESRAVIDRQEKLASLGILAAGVAHEIRNPLTAIKVRLFTLRDELEPIGAGQEDTGIIASEIDRLERIVKDFLHFARPSDPRLERLPCATLLAEVEDLFAAELKNQSIVLEVEESGETVVHADPQQLKQVLINLIRNAAESIRGTGTIRLRARRGRGQLAAGRRTCIFLEVEDNGGGIPAKAQKRLFDPFFSTKETGTGLGLPIAARIADAHGGQLTYETRSGEGTTFRVVLPADDRRIRE